MVSDHSAILQMQQKYPDKFRYYIPLKMAFATENTIKNQHKQQQKTKEKETKNHTTTNHTTNRTKKTAKNDDIGNWVISEVFSMIIGKKNNENIYIVKIKNDKRDIGHVLTTYYAQRLNRNSLHKINQMQILHKERMRTRKHKNIKTKPTIIEITDKTELKLNFTYFNNGGNNTKIGPTFYLTKSKYEDKTFTHWENCEINESNQEFVKAIVKWEWKEAKSQKQPQKINKEETTKTKTKENTTEKEEIIPSTHIYEKYTYMGGEET